MQADEGVSLMTSSPKRPWFRFHLLTAVLMMVAAGGVIGANTVSHPSKVISTMDEGILYRGGRGWPFCFEQGCVLMRPMLGDDYITSEAVRFLQQQAGRSTEYNCTVTSVVVLDFLIAVLIIVSVALVSEFSLRRREYRKP